MTNPLLAHADYCDKCGSPIDTLKPVVYKGISLEHSILSYKGRKTRITAQQAILMRMLLLRQRVSHETLVLALESEAEDGLGLMKMQMHWLRAGLQKFGLPFSIRSIYGVGYELVPSNSPTIERAVKR